MVMRVKLGSIAGLQPHCQRPDRTPDHRRPQLTFLDFVEFIDFEFNFVNEDPSAELLASIAVMAVEEVKRFGLPPKVAFLSHSNYGSSNRASARKMRLARDLFAAMAPDVECDGEMHGDAALSETIRGVSLTESTLHGEANILICPNLDAANILFNVLKVTGGHGVTVGPMLLGAAATAHVLTPSATVRRVVNMTALAVADTNALR